MTDHKFEPFEKVLVRDFDTQNWKADLFSHKSIEDGDTFFVCMGEAAWLQCIPYTPETAHLLGTSKPYEPPIEYERGQKVEVLVEDDWESALYLKYDADDKDTPHEVHAIKSGIEWVASNKIRPLPDDTAAH